MCIECDLVVSNIATQVLNNVLTKCKVRNETVGKEQL